MERFLEIDVHKVPDNVFLNTNSNYIFILYFSKEITV
jgi:hypothetical protein